MSNTINMRTFGLKMIAGVAIAVTSVGTTLSNPAQAASINAGSILNISNVAGGGIKYVNDISTGSSIELDVFGPSNGNRVIIGASTGTFVGATSNPTPATTLKNLTLSLVSGSATKYKLASPVTNYLNGLDVSGGPGTGNDVQFDLTSFLYDTVTGDALVQGFFKYGPNTIAGAGRFTSQLDIARPSSFSMSITAVPTPALLPGIIGLGLGALRKRRQGQAAEQSA
jgi:hypothetical protein